MANVFDDMKSVVMLIGGMALIALRNVFSPFKRRQIPFSMKAETADSLCGLLRLYYASKYRVSWRRAYRRVIGLKKLLGTSRRRHRPITGP